MKTKLLYFVIAFGFSILNSVYSQQGKVDATFNTYDDGLLGDGFDGAVRTVSLQLDGKLIAGGEYLNFNGSSTPYLCRLFPDGSKDASFALVSGFNGNVYSSSIQPDGKIIVGGSFTKFNGSEAGRLIRLNSDGSIDATFDTAISANSGIVHAIAMQSDGNMVIVGTFAKYNNVTVNRIARILPNGNLDTSFVTGIGVSGVVNTVQIQSDGKIIIAGAFTSFNGTSCSRIIRLNANGSIDAGFNIGTGFDDDARTLAIQTDGKILIGGDFTTYNGSTANRIIRLNTDGTGDNSFNSGSGFSDAGVNVIKLDSSGSIMVGGSFNAKYNGVDVNKLVLLDSNGGVNPTFDIGSGPASASVLALASEPSGYWYVGGSFSVFDSQNQGRLAKIDGMGTLDIGYLTAGVGFDNSVLKVISLSDNKTMAFGNFTKFNGTSVSRIARLLEDGVLDLSFNSAGVGANNSIKTAVIQTDKKIVIAGNFTSYNGIITNRIARISTDGAADPTFSVGTGFNNQVYALALQPDGKVVVGGNFTIYNSTSVNRIVRLLSDGTIDLSFNIGSGADGIVETMLLQPDGKIVLGGRFSTYNGNSYNKLVRLNTDGSVDASFSSGSGFDKYVYTIAIQSDNKLIIGGTFLNYAGASAKRILRLNVNGSLDTTFSAGSGFSNGEVRSILVQPDNRLLIGGTFSGTYNGTSVKRMMRLLPDGVYDTTFSVNLNSTLYSSCFTPDNKVMIGGNFNSVSGITKHRIARLKLCTNSSVWNGVSWSNGLPSIEKTLIFNGAYPSFTSKDVCSCSIGSGSSVTIKNGNSLGLTFDYTGLGTLILENNASLYQSDDDIKNTGMIDLKRQTTGIVKTDYSYWSSPVSNQRLVDVSPNTHSDKFYSFDATTYSWLGELPTNVMGVGKGYVIRGPESFSTTVPAIYEAVFVGVPNNGMVSVPIALKDSSNLIGNPYPSALDGDTFLKVNNGILNGTIYFWTHNTPITNNVYTSNDYAVYNLLGGVATSAALNSGVNNTKPDGKIASGQAFFITSLMNGGTVVFNNSMRIAGNNAGFFKPGSIKKTKELNGVVRHRIWLNFSNRQGAYKQALIGYITDATNDYDSSFDGESFDGNQYVDFYSINREKNLVIQGRALPFQETDEVPLGYSTSIDGTFTISIDQLDGLFLDQSIFIEDKLNSVVFDLKKGNYNFETTKGTFNNRFILRYANKNLETNEFKNMENRVLISNKNNRLKINSLINSIDKVMVYDVSGRSIYQKDFVNNKDFSESKPFNGTRVLVVKVLLEDGTNISKKIIVQE